MSTIRLVTIVNGQYRNHPMNGTFVVDKPYAHSTTGGLGTITVATGDFRYNKTGKWRITVAESDLTYHEVADLNNLPEGIVIGIVGGIAPAQGGFTMNPTNPIPLTLPTLAQTGLQNIALPALSQSHASSDVYLESIESEEDAMVRIRSKFEILNELAESVALGDIAGLVVAGAPGVGKSFGVEAVLSKINATHLSRGAHSDMYEFITGSISAVRLYSTLYHNREAGKVTVFDDNDTMFSDEESLNILKAVLDTKQTRKVSWTKMNMTLDAEGVPSSFEFEGGIIFLSNTDFMKQIQGNTKMGKHLEAIISRVNFLDMSIHSRRDKILRIKQVINDGMLDEEFGFDESEKQEIITYIEENKDYLLEISLRSIIKIARFKKKNNSTWKRFSDETLLSKEAYKVKLINAHKAKLAAEAEATKAAEEAAKLNESENVVDAATNAGTSVSPDDVVVETTPTVENGKNDAHEPALM